jgi:glycerophosphoryl diester phosphodiesterase
VLGSKQLSSAALELGQALQADVIGWEAGALDRQQIDQIHQAGLKAWAWTVDDPALARRLLDARIDGLISNRPASIQSLLADGAGTQ